MPDDPILILNVDDNEAQRYTKTRILRHAGFQVVEAGFGREALAKCEELEPAVVVLDVHAADGGEMALRMLDEVRPDILVADFAMPGRNGAEVARDIRARLPKLPILFVTGYADLAALEAAVGKAPLLRKPFRTTELLNAIRNLVDQPEP